VPSPATGGEDRAIAAMRDAFRTALAAHDGQPLLGLLLGPDVGDHLEHVVDPPTRVRP